LPPPPDAHWADVRGRDEGNDFDSVLPGGEMRGLLSLTTVAETLELVSRVFHYIASHPERVEPSRVQPVRESTSPLDMPPSQLPASAVTLETGS
jgi:hypothetical protein